MSNFLQLLLFTGSQILPGRIDFSAAYISVSNWNRSFMQQIFVRVVPRTSKVSKSTSLELKVYCFPGFLVLNLINS